MATELRDAPQLVGAHGAVQGEKNKAGLCALILLTCAHLKNLIGCSLSPIELGFFTLGSRLVQLSQRNAF